MTPSPKKKPARTRTPSKPRTRTTPRGPARPWQAQVSDLLARGRTTQALHLLDRIIRNQQLELFRSPRSLGLDRRLAWMFRIEVLRECGRTHEALAWTLLECELNPNNETAKAMRRVLKQELAPPSRKRSSRSAANNVFSMPRSLRGGPARPDANRWKGVAGMRELKAILERDVILPFREPELYLQYKLALPSGILLYGPPGCGKTHIARALAGQLATKFMEVKPSDLGSTLVHGSQIRIGEIFDEARKAAPTLLFFDELDALCPTRDDDLNHHYAAEVNELLTQLNDCTKHRILVVGATNRPDRIDPAILRPGRFDKKIEVGPPDLEARVELLRLYLAERPHADVDFIRLGRETEGYTCAEIEHVTAEAARRALGRRRSIVEEDVLAAMAVNLPGWARGSPGGEGEVTL